MNIWEWPAQYRSTIESQFYLASSSLSAMSPYTGEVTPYGPQVQKWSAKLTFPGQLGPDWRFLSGFITRLRGITGAVRIVDYHRMRCGYDVAADPSVSNWSNGSTWSDGRGWEAGLMPPFVTVDEAARAGHGSMVLRGFPPNVTLPLRLGDLFEHRPNGVALRYGALYEVTGDTRSNSAGKLRVYFEPELRAAASLGDQIVIRYPTSVFSLASDQEGIVSRSAPGNLGHISLNLIERLTAPE